MNLIKSTTTYSFFVIISRVLGYIRDVLIAIYLGSGPIADAFFVAFRIPNTFRRLFSEGTFNSAFVPSYMSEQQKGKDNSKKFANNVFNFLVLGLLFLVFLVEIFMPVFVFLIAPGFSDSGEKLELTINLTRITFPFLIFVSLSSFFGAILNSYNKFAAASAAPIILNVFLILTLLFANYLNDTLVFYLSYAVTAAGILQLIFLVFFTRKYYFPKFSFKIKLDKKLKFFFKKLLPSIFSSGVTQINILVGTIIASFQSGAVSYLYYAERVYQINLALAGIAVGTVSLPALSKSIKSKDYFKTFDIQNKSIQLSLLLSIPASLGLILASEEIVNGLFGYGSFTSADVEITSRALSFFGYGVVAFALIKILSNFFFARDNTKVPFYISALIVLLNVLISLSFFNQIGFLIIPIATSISTWIGVVIFLYILIRKNFINLKIELFKNILKILISSLIMSLMLVFSLEKFSSYLDYEYIYKSIYLLIIIGFVGIIYLLSCYLLGLLKIKSYKTN